MVGHEQYAISKVQHPHQPFEPQTHGEQEQIPLEQGQDRPEGVDVKPQVEAGGVPS